LEEAKGTLLAYDNIALAEGPQPPKAYIQAIDQRAAHRRLPIGGDGPDQPKTPPGLGVPDPGEPMPPPRRGLLQPRPYPPPPPPGPGARSRPRRRRPGRRASRPPPPGARRRPPRP